MCPSRGGRAPSRPKRPPKPLCEALGLGKDDLLALGIPERWVERVLAESDPENLLDLGQNHLPPDAAEAVRMKRSFLFSRVQVSDRGMPASLKAIVLSAEVYGPKADGSAFSVAVQAVKDGRSNTTV